MLGEILIILSPIAPHIMSELWQSFCSVNNKLYTDFDWSKGVFHQSFPELDPNFNLDLNVKCNNKTVAKLQVAKWYFDSLTEDQAFDLCCHEQNIQNEWLKYELVEKSFSKTEDFAALLELSFEVPCNNNEDDKLSPEDFERQKRERKEAKRQEKLAKKAAKEERKRIYEANVARKEKISKTFQKSERGE